MSEKAARPEILQYPQKEGVGWVRRFSTLVGLVLICLVLTLTSKHFFSFENFINVLLQNANIAVLAVGLTLVILLGEIDLSVGGVEALPWWRHDDGLRPGDVPHSSWSLAGTFADWERIFLSLTASTPLPTRDDGIARGSSIPTGFHGLPDLPVHGQVDGPILSLSRFAVVLCWSISCSPRFGLNHLRCWRNIEAAGWQGLMGERSCRPPQWTLQRLGRVIGLSINPPGTTETDLLMPLPRLSLANFTMEEWNDSGRLGSRHQCHPNGLNLLGVSHSGGGHWGHHLCRLTRRSGASSRIALP
jgi:hypothetical protein